METYLRIDESYYLEKIAELELLVSQLLDTEQRYRSILQRLGDIDATVRERVQNDLRWLHSKQVGHGQSS